MNHFIKNAALSIGFDACGIAKAELLEEDAAYLRQWLNNGKQGEMHYLERNFEKRTDPRLLVPGCKSVVVVLMNYYPTEHQIADAPQISKYAYSSIDYHTVIKEKLHLLEQLIIEAYGSDIVAPEYQHIFVDSAPVLERRWAERAGLGWIGKHTQLISPGLGSYFFIGILMINAETEYDAPMAELCGKCTRCIDACPTKALAAREMDARRCISYLTIENKKDISKEFIPILSNRMYGCDICADVCPWNKKWATPHNKKEFAVVPGMLQWDTETWEKMTKEQFNAAFKFSAVQRAGYKKFMQNINLLRNQQ
ncbi:MAG: tRNA epoxyqueuosine(34) reductase QueG [Paludibacter sp.]|nr:tRNA epoxyqueuosine(34) reductase QueG [Paludibacter sp.]